MKKRLLLAGLFCSLLYAQDQYLYQLQGPGDSWLAVPVNPITGNFSALNLRETDPDYTALLFSGPAMSSHIAYYIDQTPYHQSNLQISVPIGPTAGYQIDGVFQSPEGIRIETAYFLMGADLSGELKTLGIAVLVSNTSSAPRRVGVKILLDTEIGEVKRNPLLYLPSGRPIDRPYRFPKNNLPAYIFAGERGSAAGTGEGKGVYIYPYLSTNFPSMVAVENWRRMASAPWLPSALGSDFIFNRGSMPDAGVGIYFGEFALEPQKEITLGAAVSLEKIVTVPVLKEDERTRSILSDEALSRGVFAPERYLINEMAVNPGSAILAEMAAQKQPLRPIPGRGIPPIEESNKKSSAAAPPQRTPEEIIMEYRTKDLFGRQILKMDYTMDYLRQIYNESLGFSPETNRSFGHPPYQGITERVYDGL